VITRRTDPNRCALMHRGDNPAERYAAFFTPLELSAQIMERSLTLTRARWHWLGPVVVVTANGTIERTFKVCSPTLLTHEFRVKAMIELYQSLGLLGKVQGLLRLPTAPFDLPPPVRTPQSVASPHRPF
jgi:hypothetical protein